ncbi:hypothetical protein IMSAG250_00020 [Clostridiales bacterium]|nr:hypothetical protein IMSAG250_00020 [Clostridiales bacterium]
MVLSILFDEIPRVLIPVLLFYIPLRTIYLRKHNKKIKWIEELTNLAFVFYVCAIAAILLIPRFEIFIKSYFPPKFGCIIAFEFADTENRSINIIPLASISQQIRDWKNGIGESHPFTNLIANLCLMVPMPVFIKLINNKIKGIYCLAITLGIIIFCEISQYFRAGRTCDIDDIILNFFGAVIGMTMFNISKNIYSKVKQNNK